MPRLQDMSSETDKDVAYFAFTAIQTFKQST
jgi:hypothetical protein